jgi:hypothetical protein
MLYRCLKLGSAYPYGMRNSMGHVGFSQWSEGKDILASYIIALPCADPLCMTDSNQPGILLLTNIHLIEAKTNNTVRYVQCALL